jgi:hypothetical protein
VSWGSELVSTILWCLLWVYDIVSFLIPNPQHTVSLYTFTYQESSWSGRSGLTISRTQRNILRYSSRGIADTGIVPDTGTICHDSPWHLEVIDTPSRFRLTRKTTVLVKVFPTVYPMRL